MNWDTKCCSVNKEESSAEIRRVNKKIVLRWNLRAGKQIQPYAEIRRASKQIGFSAEIRTAGKQIQPYAEIRKK
jgi:hypothetical protein